MPGYDWYVMARRGVKLSTQEQAQRRPAPFAYPGEPLRGIPVHLLGLVSSIEIDAFYFINAKKK
jgi:hypothetical protein